jgi:hypothetical protein
LLGRASIVRTIVLRHCSRSADAGGQNDCGDAEFQQAQLVLSPFRWEPPTCQNQVRGYVVGIATFEPRHGELGLGKSRSIE